MYLFQVLCSGRCTSFKFFVVLDVLLLGSLYYSGKNGSESFVLDVDCGSRHTCLSHHGEQFVVFWLEQVRSTGPLLGFQGSSDVLLSGSSYW